MAKKSNTSQMGSKMRQSAVNQNNSALSQYFNRKENSSQIVSEQEYMRNIRTPSRYTESNSQMSSKLLTQEQSMSCNIIYTQEDETIEVEPKLVSSPNFNEDDVSE
jgi:predicted choloylglycine hydrolase